METIVLWGGILAIYTAWLVFELIKNKGKTMPKLVLRAMIFFAIIAWFLILVRTGMPIFSYFNNNAFIIIASLAFLVMIWSFVAPYIKLEKGTPEYEMVKGGIITLALLIIYLVYLVNTR